MTRCSPNPAVGSTWGAAETAALSLIDSALARIAVRRLPASGVTGRTKFNEINESCKFFCGWNRTKRVKSCNSQTQPTPPRLGLARASPVNVAAQDRDLPGAHAPQMRTVPSPDAHLGMDQTDATERLRSNCSYTQHSEFACKHVTVDRLVRARSKPNLELRLPLQGCKLVLRS